MNVFSSLVRRYRKQPGSHVETVKIEEDDDDDQNHAVIIEPSFNLKSEVESVSTVQAESSTTLVEEDIITLSDTESTVDVDDIIVLEDLTVIDDTGSIDSPAPKKCRRSSAAASTIACASFLNDSSITVLDETFGSTNSVSSKKTEVKRRRSSLCKINSPIVANSAMLKAFVQGTLFPQMPKDIDLLSKMCRIKYQKTARQWEQVQQLNPNNLKRKSKFIEGMRVCTYNVLCQITSEKTGYLYKHLGADKQALQWDKRWSLLRDELNMLDADVFCLQEVQHDHFDQCFKPHLERLGYSCYYKRKTADDYFDGCAFFFRSEKFELISRRDLEYFVKVDTVMDRPQIGQIFRLRCKRTKQQVIFANTHLIFNNNRGDVKFGQSMMLMANIHKELNDNGECPVIVMGDFNIEANSYIYKYFQYSKSDIRGIPRNELSGQGNSGGPVIDPTLIIPPSAMIGTNSIMHDKLQTFEQAEKAIVNKYEITHPLKLTSVYSDAVRRSDWTPISTFHADSGNPDYIFYSVKRKDFDESALAEKVFELPSLKLLRRLSLPSLQMAKETVGPWPNQYIPSDHIPLVADFILCS